jgi:hypothetical protein
MTHQTTLKRFTPDDGRKPPEAFMDALVAAGYLADLQGLRRAIPSDQHTGTAGRTSDPIQEVSNMR